MKDFRDKNITTFCKEYDVLCHQVDQGNVKKHKYGSRLQPLFLELEDIIWEWIVYKRARTLVVRKADILAFSLTTAIQLDMSSKLLKASWHWLDGLYSAIGTFLRKSITMLMLDDNEVIEQIFALNYFVDGIDFTLKWWLTTLVPLQFIFHILPVFLKFIWTRKESPTPNYH